MENFEHLNQETKEIMYSSKEERLYYLEKNLFIDYPRTKELMDLLARMMNSPKKPRMQNLDIHFILPYPRFGINP